MTELIGDICQPVELIVPVIDGDTTDGSTTKPTISGALLMSGKKLYFYDGDALQLITS